MNLGFILKKLLLLLMWPLFLTVIRKIPGSTNMNLSVSFPRCLHGYLRFFLPIIRYYRLLCFFLFFFLKNEEILTTCLYPQTKLNWIGNEWTPKHCCHLLVLHLMTDNYLIFILKQGQWHWCSLHCMKERQSQGFAFVWLSNWFFKIGNLYSHLDILWELIRVFSYTKQDNNTKTKNC